MLFKLFLIFSVVPLTELALLIKVGSVIGTLNTIGIVILTALIGAYMVKLEGLGVLNRLQSNVNQGVFPAEELIDGILILIAGALLLTPGLITDSFGFLAVFPASRGVIKNMLKRYLQNKVALVQMRSNFNDTDPFE
jgi:UPF0716 protein FxsA